MRKNYTEQELVDLVEEVFTQFRKLNNVKENKHLPNLQNIRLVIPRWFHRQMVDTKLILTISGNLNEATTPVLNLSYNNIPCYFGYENKIFLYNIDYPQFNLNDLIASKEIN